MNHERRGAAPIETPSPGRLMSLDVFRGATIASMILVNNPGNWGAIYKPLDHAEWHGWTFTDLIFPFFIWIVGVAIPLSTGRRLEQRQSRQQLLMHALRRSAIIIALGFFLNSFLYLIDGSLFRDGFSAWFHNYATTVRVPGVLQRIGVCYFIATLIFLGTGIRGQIIWIAALLAGYWVLMIVGPWFGWGTGGLEQHGNFSEYIDNLVLNGKVIGVHVWKGGKTWDPEGIFSTVPAIATCLFGIMTGHLIRSKQTSETKTAWLFAGGNLLLFAGVMMDVWLPINKKLWTSSYSVFMAGMAMNCFAVCHWLVDVQGWRKWAKPFAIYGMNAIAVFMMAGLLGRILPTIKVATAAGRKVGLQSYLYDNLFAPFASPDTAPFFGFLASPKNASLMWALMYMIGLYLIAYGMYRRKWFLKF
jgi:predicted acyltransferase